MSHRNAALTPRHRLRVALLVIEDGWPISEVAARFQVSWPTVKRSVEPYVAGEPMQDRSSRPKSSPNKTSTKITKRCVSLRTRLREGPVQLASRLAIAPYTVHRILKGARTNRFSYVDRATGETIRRYEHDHPGSLVHVDVKKLGYAFVHTVNDDHSRVAYTEVQDDETAAAAAADGVLHRAVEWFSNRVVAIERVLSDNGGAYRSNLWRDTCEVLSIAPKRTRPYRPQTNGKVELFHRTMADGWAYTRCYTSEQERRDALTDWLHHYNQPRPHTACGSRPPFSRLINVSGQYN